MLVNTREIFLKVMNFEPCERTICWELGYWGETLTRWYREGLPRSRNPKRVLDHDEGLMGEMTLCFLGLDGKIMERDYDVNKYFGFDEGLDFVPCQYWIYPGFEKKIIFEDDTSIELIDMDGIRRKEFKNKVSMPLWIEFPVKNRADWERVKEERFSLNNLADRFPINMDTIKKKREKRNTLLAILAAPVGFFGSIRALLGEKRLYMMYYDDPDLVKDIAQHLCSLWLAISEELTSKFDFDIALFWEDMAGKQGSLVSPSIFREFMMPYYKKLIGFLKSRGIKHFLVDSDGKLDELIPLFIESGINSIMPIERQAGNDIIEIRKKYPELGILGGFDKNSLAKGRENIDKELEKIEWVIKTGGYIPSGDHSIPPDSSWESFKYYRTKLNNIISTTKILKNK
jgi:uroporphyrinogen-III decarboxylase